MSFYFIFILCLNFQLIKMDNALLDYKDTDADVDLRNENQTSLKKNRNMRNENQLQEYVPESDYVEIQISGITEFRNAITDPRGLWPEGVIPYIISEKYDVNERKLIIDAMESFENKTCIRFEPKVNETAYITILPGKGCKATVGKGVESKLILGPGCRVQGVIIHELMHILGFFHEQNRSDRDKFVNINWDNIQEKSKGNFKKQPEHWLQRGGIHYDYDSIMHYGTHAFAIKSSIPTIVPIKKGVEIGKRKNLSEMDVKKINIIYNCNISEPRAEETDRNATENISAAPVSFSISVSKKGTEASDSSLTPTHSPYPTAVQLNGNAIKKFQVNSKKDKRGE